MKEFEPSRTAMMVALQRAAHQMLDVPRVFSDDFAVRILGGDSSRLIENFVDESDSKRDLSSISSRAFLVARSRYAEDQIYSAFQRGVRQCIILGAGLDTFGYRCKELGVRIFEVDHPATQAWKQGLLADAEIQIPNSVSFTAVDFGKMSLKTELVKSGWNDKEPSVLSWLGVTAYLSESTVLEMLAFLSTFVTGSGIVFDYVIPPHLMTSSQQEWFEWLNPKISASGEPLQTFFAPSNLNNILTNMGFSSVEDLSPEDLNMRYFSDRQDSLKTVTTLSHMVSAILI